MTPRKTSPMLRGVTPMGHGYIQPCHMPQLFATGVAVRVTGNPLR